MVANSSSCDAIRKVVSSHGSLTTILGLDEVQSFFLIIAGGLAMSFIIFLLETVVIKIGNCFYQRARSDTLVSGRLFVPRSNEIGSPHY